MERNEAGAVRSRFSSALLAGAVTAGAYIAHFVVVWSVATRIGSEPLSNAEGYRFTQLFFALAAALAVAAIATSQTVARRIRTSVHATALLTLALGVAAAYPYWLLVQDSALSALRVGS